MKNSKKTKGLFRRVLCSVLALAMGLTCGAFNGFGTASAATTYYTITLVSTMGSWADGSTSKTVTVKEGDTLDLESQFIPSCSTRSFAGWSTSISNVMSPGNLIDSITPTSDKCVYACWDTIDDEDSYQLVLYGLKKFSDGTITINGHDVPNLPFFQKIADGTYDYRVYYSSGYTPNAVVYVPAGTTIKLSDFSFTVSEGYSWSSSKGWQYYSTGRESGYYKKTDTFTMPSKNANLIPYGITANFYYVYYYANSGSGSMSYQTMTYDTAEKLTANAYTRTGYTFQGWTTASSSSAVTYADQESVVNLSSKSGDTVRLYAVWKANSYTVKYNANGGSGTMLDMAMTYDTAATLTANAFSRKGYTFQGWSTKADATEATYTDQASVKNLSSTSDDVVTLYAVWDANTYTVKYNANGGSGSMSNKT
ncbi:MAG: InlB B-repeat-containing protein, partial [Clostridiaceae bacterium]|nr:InlB B-repeat-containing protein [Clostridiaceae bacterium]